MVSVGECFAISPALRMKRKKGGQSFGLYTPLAPSCISKPWIMAYDSGMVDDHDVPYKLRRAVIINSRLTGMGSLFHAKSNQPANHKPHLADSSHILAIQLNARRQSHHISWSEDQKRKEGLTSAGLLSVACKCEGGMHGMTCGTVMTLHP